MKVSQAKANILKKIRQALSQSTPLPFPQSEGNQSVFAPVLQDPESEFAEQFSKLQGKFIFCIDHQELAAQLNVLVQLRGWKNIYCREAKLGDLLKKHLFNNFSESALEESDAAI